MPTQYTSRLGIALPTTGELDGTWGSTLNAETFELLDEAISGLVVINTWTANSHTLTTANGAFAEARNAILKLTDTNIELAGAGTVIAPDSTKIYTVVNGTGQSITIKTALGTGVVVEDGAVNLVASDGTNIIDVARLQIASEVAFTPAGNIAATNVQAALQELDTEKATAAQGALADTAVQPGDNVSALTNDAAYLSANQTITLSGDVSGSGTTAITVTVADDSHAHTGSTISGLDAGDTTTGTFADARISESSVTQHQSAINAGKVDGYDISVLTQVEYDALTPDANTIYLVI